MKAKLLALLLCCLDSACSGPPDLGAELKMGLYYPAEQEIERLSGRGYMRFSSDAEGYWGDLHASAAGDVDIFLFLDRFYLGKIEIYRQDELVAATKGLYPISAQGPAMPEPGDRWNFVWEAPYYPNGKSGVIATATVTFVPADSYRE